MAAPVVLTAWQRFTTIKDPAGTDTPVIGVRILYPTTPAIPTNHITWFTLVARPEPARPGRRPTPPTTPPSLGKIVNISIGGDKYRREWHVLIGETQMDQKIDLKVNVENENGNPICESTIHLATSSPLNAQQDIALQPDAPQMRQLLFGPLLVPESDRMANAGPIIKDGDDPQAVRPEREAQAVVEVLKHVHDRLRAGLGELWLAGGLSTRKQGRALSDWNVDDLTTESELREAWAQAITEHVVGSAYVGPGQFMGSWVYNLPGLSPQHMTDASVLMSIRRHLGTSRPHTPLAQGGFGRSNATGELCVPLGFACQQLSAWTLFTAGHERIAEDPVSASIPHPGLVEAPQTHSLSNVLLTPSRLRKGTPPDGFAPGTLLFRDTAAHVGVIIRTPGQESFQLLDSGGWNSGAAEGSGNHDTRPITQTTDTSSGYVVPHPAIPHDLKLVIKRLRSARPLGLAQLMIYRRKTTELERADLLWSTGLVPLHEALDGTPLPGTTSMTGADATVPLPPNQASYPISRLIASLRGCPHADELSVHWFVYTPVHGSGNSTLRDAEKTNNIAYVIRHGNRPTPDSQFQKRWWEEERSDLTLTAASGDAEGPGYGPRPIGLNELTQLSVHADGTPFNARMQADRKPPMTAFPAYIRTLRNHTLSSAPPSGYPAFVDFRNRDELRQRIPKFFGGESDYVPDQPQPSPQPQSDTTDWFQNEAWEIPCSDPSASAS